MDDIVTFARVPKAATRNPLTNTTFVHGLAILEALARANAPRGVTELARELNLAKSNVHRLLQTLCEHGYARKLGLTGRYEVTLRVWELGAAVLHRLDVKRVAIPEMERLAQISGETVNLSMLDHGEVIYIDKVDSPKSVRDDSKLGGRAPAYCVATGKAQLAHAPAAAIDEVLNGLHRFTSSTIVDPAALRSELAQVRNTGYAINRGEWQEGYSAVAAPIRNGRGTVIAGIGVSGPVQRLRGRVLLELAPDVVAVARQVSTRLGWNPGRRI